MGEPIVFTTPSGDEMAVIPLQDYRRLVEAAEDAADVRAYDEAKRRLASGGEEFVPLEFVDRMLAGESRVRVWREHRGLGAATLAEKAGIPLAELDQIESGQREAGIGTLRRIADTLGVELDDLA